MVKTETARDELKYKEYREYYKRISLEAENSYYSELFNRRTNSMKQLWRNLNHVTVLTTLSLKINVFQN